MSFTLDPDVTAAMSALAGDGPPPPAPVLGD